ncbi:MAG: hypothetical protein AAF615_06010 [Pseudomonadota bacterium]
MTVLSPVSAIIPADIEAEAPLAALLKALTALEIHCESKDFRRPAPLLAALYELATGRPFERHGAWPLVFGRASEAGEVTRPRRRVAWLRIDSRFGDLAMSTGRHVPLGRRLRLLPPSLCESLSTGDAVLVLDWSHTGAARFDTGPLEEAAMALDIPAQNILLLTQNTAQTNPPQGHGPQVRIAHAHADLPKLWRLAFGPLVRPSEYRLPFGFALTSSERPQRFVCRNTEATATRALIAARLSERTEPGLIEFPRDRFVRNMPRSAAFQNELNQVSLAGAQLSNQSMVARFIAERRSNVGAPQTTGGTDLSPNEALAVAAWADVQVVADREMGFADQCHISPELLCAVVAGTPFLSFGARGAVALLRDSGFDVHDGLVDHAYDARVAPSERLEMAFRTLEDMLERQGPLSSEALANLAEAARRNERVFRTAGIARWASAAVSAIAGLPLSENVDERLPDLADVPATTIPRRSLN